MRLNKVILIAAVLFSISCKEAPKDIEDGKSKRFNIGQDLLLAQYDCKTDVDDLHSIAAFATLMSNAQFSKINYHGIAGTYGTQEGLYVPPNDLFRLVFGENWTDAHADLEAAVAKVMRIAVKTLNNQGDVWIAEAGQSDFSAHLIKAIQEDSPDINTTNRIHIVQHSDWNEKVSGPENLLFAKQNADYHKIPDGNALDNGTPGFRDPDFSGWNAKMTNKRLIEIWELAINLGNKYNGQEGRYLNEAIQAGGLDFSDFSEVCWILDLENIKDAKQFFEIYSN